MVVVAGQLSWLQVEEEEPESREQRQREQPQLEEEGAGPFVARASVAGAGPWQVEVRYGPVVAAVVVPD